MVAFPEAMQYKDRPQHVGEITGGDLDRVVWTDILTNGAVSV